MDLLDLAIVLAGVGAGLAGSVAGLASVVSYPALLAAGLPPLAANVTNSVALLGNSAGAVAGSRPELRGQRGRVVDLGASALVGGVAGAALLLLGGEAAFRAVVPWLVAAGSVLLLARERLRRWARSRTAGPPGRHDGRDRLLVAAVGVYAGYFGAASGIMMLAALAARTDEPLPVTNAVKNVLTGLASGVSAVVFLVIAPVDLRLALLLGAGALVGGVFGPRLVRVLPETPLRWGIGLAGLGLAASLL